MVPGGAWLLFFFFVLSSFWLFLEVCGGSQRSLVIPTAFWKFLVDHGCVSFVVCLNGSW